jgi:hypothetical protein
VRCESEPLTGCKCQLSHVFIVASDIDYNESDNIEYYS